uniref:ribosomal protein L18 n=1 Tax=Goniotrichopsis reniformis TaxID=468933 RepID=UPI001FCD27A1|nr:ribosomal protein L18 [Goniotrichopsis reniformis]UNJ14775.1 ribosomal protein L18 [Goniotrichopsis reniformis]
MLTRKLVNLKKRKRIRKKVHGTSVRPRLSVYRSNHHIYAQIIDDSRGYTIVQSSTIDKELKEKINSGATCIASVEVGKLIAARALAKGCSEVVFDRGGKLYHGRVKALAESARENGLIF